MAVSKAILERVNSLIFGKKKLFFRVFFDYFFSIFFFSIHTLGSRIIFLCSHIFRKRYGFFFFKKEIIYFLCILLCFPKELLFGFFWNIIIKKLWRGRRRDQNGKMRFGIASKKVYFELETDLYLAKIFDFEFQHHDHQTSL